MFRLSVRVGWLGRVAVGAALVAACDLGESDYGYVTGFGGSGGAPGIYADGGSAASPPGPCDDAEEDAYCDDAYAYDDDLGYGAYCELKTSANLSCNTVLKCTSDGYWTRIDPQRTSCATACPSAYVDRFDCSDPASASLICEYPEGTCGCAPLRPDGGVDAGDGDGGVEADVSDAGTDGGDAEAPAIAYAWRCVTPEAGCPRLRPREGDDCVKPMSCNYGDCLFEDGVTMRCSDRRWTASRCGE